MDHKRDTGNRGRSARPPALFEIVHLQHVGVRFADFALLDLLSFDENGEGRQTVLLGAAGRLDQGLERLDCRRGAAPRARRLFP